MLVATAREDLEIANETWGVLADQRALPMTVLLTHPRPAPQLRLEEECRACTQQATDLPTAVRRFGLGLSALARATACRKHEGGQAL